MRTLKTADVFSFCRVVKASGVREELTALVRKLGAANKKLDAESVGYDAILLIVESLADRKAEKALYEAIAPIIEKTADEVAEMPPAEFTENIKAIFESNDMANFFNCVSGILGKK